MLIALIGNQNCGKTTLFNQLTGSSQHVGNFPGVTVEKKEGQVRREPSMTLVDLPGLYSLSPYTSEEVVSQEFLLKEKPAGIINILDATNIERSLYLTLQILDLGIPTVLAMNMMDEVRASGHVIHADKIAKALGVPVVPISAIHNEGLDALVSELKTVVNAKEKREPLDISHGYMNRALHAISHIIEDHAEDADIPLQYAAIKLMEGDENMETYLGLTDMERDIIDHIVDDMEDQLMTDSEAALADMRYEFIDSVCKTAVIKAGETQAQKRSVAIDRILTHKIFAIPIFVAIMAAIFYITFGPIGTFLSDGFSAGVDAITGLVDKGLTAWGLNPVVHSLIIDGVFAGVGSVLSFLPVILVLFFFLSLLEDSGYMARVAFVMDQLLRKLGLSGKSFVPMIIGFGCVVPAVMATRTLASDRDRKMTILLTPFMSCPAKLPIYAAICAVFFPAHKGIVMISLYLLGIVVAIILALIFKKTLFKGDSVPFVLELPAYRFPAPKSVLLHMWQKAKDFIEKAFTIIFVATVVIWFLQTFDFRLNVVADSADSMLAALGRLIAPVFKPLGFGDWRAATALVTGLTAKEAVVSTLTVLTGDLNVALATIFTPLTAFVFLVFTLLYMPCVAAVAAIRRELGSTGYAALAMAFQTAVAWLVAFGVYLIGGLIV